MRVYSPSQTEQFLQCPVWWSLSHDWQLRAVNGPRDLGRMLGRAYAAGLALYYRDRQQTAQPSTNPTGIAETAVAAALLTLHAADDLAQRVVNDRDQEQLALLPQRVEKAVRRTIEADPIPREWVLTAVEEGLGAEYGNAVPDLVVSDGRGVVPVDFKLKLAIRGRSPADRDWNRAALLTDYEQSWQLHHYCWALGADHYYIALAVLEPRFSIELLPFEVHPETLALWYEYAQVAWARMEAVEEGMALPITRMPCRTQFGLCDCNAAVWKHHLDPSLMEEDYVRLVRTPA